jgi:aspartate racemase
MRKGLIWIVHSSGDRGSRGGCSKVLCEPLCTPYLCVEIFASIFTTPHSPKPSRRGGAAYTEFHRDLFYLPLMKTIGLIGGISWLSPIEYYKYLNQFVNDRLGGVDAAKVIIYSFNFGDIKRLTMADDWDAMADMMCHAAKQLENAGADCILMGVNTMHKVADRVQAVLKVPFIHIAEAAAEVINQRQLSKVALLGTRYVMQLDFYKNKLAEKNIEIMIPGQEDIDYINNAIYEEFGKGIFLPATKERVLQIVETMANQGAQGVIAGCTEIPLLIQQHDCPIPLFDTTAIHAKAAVDFALSTAPV